MKSNKLFFPIFIIISLFAKGQSIDYLDYHKRIATATIYLLDSNYTQSVQEYKKVAENYEFIFPKDFYIAAQVAALIDSTQLSKDFLARIIKYGVDVNFIKGNKILKRKLNTSDWEELQSVKLDTNQFSNYQYFEHIYNVDQVMKCKNDKWYTNRRFLLNKKLNRKYLALNDSLVNEIKTFTLTNGFPSYKLIGCNHQPIISGSKALIVLYHHPNAFSKMGDSLLFSEVRKGNLHLFDYALLHDFEARHYLIQPKLYKNQIIKKYKYNVRWENTDPMKTGYTKDDILTNEERAKVGLIPIKYHRKMKYLCFQYRKNYQNENALDIDFLFWNF